jgi:hypothetical protein
MFYCIFWHYNSRGTRGIRLNSTINLMWLNQRPHLLWLLGDFRATWWGCWRRGGSRIQGACDWSMETFLFSLVTVLQFEVIGKSSFSFVLSLTCDMKKHQFQCSACDIQILYHHLLMTFISPWSILDIFVKINYSVNPSVCFCTLSTIPFISVSVFMYFWMHYFQCTVLSMLCVRNT